MATPIAAPNLQRFSLPEIEIGYNSNGIIAIIDDLVERVMSAHAKKAAQEPRSFEPEFLPEDDLVSVLSVHSVYDSPQAEEAAA
jgi:hypothetical protein